MKILMVCLGNICRSPMAQGIMESKLARYKLEWQVDSAGTSAWHQGEKADPRSIQTCSENDIDINGQRARQFVKEDFANFDLILAMDVSNYNNILALTDEEQEQSKVKMVLNYLYPNENRSVPDPYYNDGFDQVFDMLDGALENVIIAYNTSN